jgi:hypothetical protein
MKRRVIIKKAPLQKAQQGLFTKKKLTNNAMQFPVTFKEGMEPNLEVKKNLGPVPRELANIEAEKGETILTPMGDDAWTKTLPKTYIIGGKKHSKGGTPLDVPEGSFIFSDHLKERNTKIHEMLGKAAKKSGYTYAELSKPYMLNDDIRVLLDPDSDRITRETAELNIKNKTDKLGMIALLQESAKGFSDDQGKIDIPAVGIPYLEKTGIDIEDAMEPFLEAIKAPVQQQQPMPGMDMGMGMEGMPPQGMEQGMPPMPMQRRGGLVKMKNGGAVPKFQDAGSVPGSKLKPGERVVYNANTQTYQIVNAQGVPVGTVNFQGEQSTKLTRPQVPSNAIVLSRKEYDADKEAAFAAAAGKPLVVKNDDGTYRVISKKPKGADYKGEDLNTIFAGDQTIARKYKYIEDKFNDPKLKAELARRAVQALGDNSKRSPGMTSAEADRLKKKIENDPEYAYKMFLDMQKRNLATLAHQNKGNIKKIPEHKDAPDSGSVTNSEFIDTWAKVGVKAPTDEEAKLQQALYYGYSSMIQDRDAGKLDKDISSAIGDFKIRQVGASDPADNTGVGGGPGKISKIDGKYTNTTTGQIAYVDDPMELAEGDLAPGEETMVPGKKPQYVKDNIPQGWTAPNIYELYRTTKELYGDRPQEPFVAAPTTYLPRGYLLSPEDMQRNYRGMSMAAGEQMMSMGMGPQAMAALTQLNGADEMAQYTAQVHNANQQTLNEVERDRGNRIQTMFQNFANVATTLHDRWAQLKDNMQARKSAARAEVSKAFAAGEQAEMDIQAVNLRTPNYKINPYTMNYSGFMPTGDIGPTQGSSTTLTDNAVSIQRQNPGMTYGEALAYAKADAGIQDNSNYLNNLPQVSQNI